MHSESEHELLTAVDAVESSTQTTAGFAALGLHETLLQAVDALGYTEPTPVQAATIPAALGGGDWMVSSQTGSGKTAAFLLPALQQVLASQPLDKDPAAAPTPRKHRAGASPRVLVLCPTRELAQQVAQEAIRLVRFTRGIRIANVVGGMSFGKQLMEIRGATLVVATPGRLLDLHRHGQIALDSVQTLVVDEADRMLDLGFAEDLEAIHLATARRERTLMFSATFAPRIMALAEAVMRAPERIELATAQDTHEHIEQRLHWFDDMAHKQALLEHYLDDETMTQAVIFTATQVDADELAEQLRDAGHAAAPLHGAMPQSIRNRRIRSLREGKIKLLVATDVAARGIDVPTITHVINYGLPMKPEDYVHRIGRTGRAGRSGLAITLAGMRDRFRIRNIERFTQQRIEEAVVPGHEPKTRPQGFGGRGGRDGRFERFERFERKDRFEPRNDRFARGERFERNDRPQRFERDERFERNDREARPVRPFDRGEGRACFEQASRFDRHERFNARQHGAPAQRDWNDRFDRGERAPQRERFGGERREFGAGYGASQPYARPARFERHERNERNERSERGGHNRFDDRYVQRQPRFEAREERPAPSFKHTPRSERRNGPPGPAQTPPAPGGNRAARRAALREAYAARMAAEQGNG